MESNEDGSSDEVMGSENIITENVEDAGQQVYGYLSVSEDTENATIIIEPQVIECGSQRLIIAQAEEGNEIYVVVSGDQEPSQNSMIHSDVILESISKHQIPQGEDITQEFQYIQEEEKPVEEEVSNENLNNEVNTETAVWALKESAANQEESTEMVFIPAQSILSSSQILTPDESKHRKLMQLACIAHEMRSADSNHKYVLSDNAEHSNNLIKESVLNTEPQNRSDEDTGDNNCIDENSGYESVDNNNEVTHVSECPSPKARVIDNAVSVIHSPPAYNAVVENSNDSVNVEDDYNQTQDVASNEQTFTECKLAMDEDSNTMSSQTSGLDLTVDSKIHYSPRAEETHFAIEESKPDFCSQTIFKRSLECENNINSESEENNIDLNVSRSASPVILVSVEKCVGDKTSLGNDSFIEDTIVGVVCENSSIEPSVDDHSDDIPDVCEVSRADSPNLISKVSNEFCNMPSSNNALTDNLNKNDLIYTCEVSEVDNSKLNSEISNVSSNIPSSSGAPKDISNRNDLINTCEVSRSDSPKLNSELSNVSCNTPSTSSDSRDNLNRNDFVLERVISPSQECQLPKKKFRLPDLEREFNMKSFPRGNLQFERKECLESNAVLNPQNTGVKQNLPKSSSNKVDDKEESGESLKCSLVDKSEDIISLQGTSKTLNDVKENLISKTMQETVEQFKNSDKNVSSIQSDVSSIQNNISSVQNEIINEKTLSNTAVNSGATNINDNSLEQKKDIYDILLEENLVKPPKVTYAARKRKMNLSQSDIISPKEPRFMFSPDNETGKKDSCSENCMTLKQDILIHGSDDIDNDFTSSKIKVSLNYTRKRKNVSPVLPENKTRSLRKRTRFSAGGDLLDADSKSDTNASNNEVTNWGNILLSTSFQTVEPACHSASHNSQSSPELSETHVKPVSKIASKSEAQWEKFMKSSSPKKVKSPDKKLRDKVKRQVRSLCKSERFSSRLLADSKESFPKSGKKKSQNSNSDKNNGVEIPVKKSGIKYFNDKQPSTSSSAPNSCSNEKDFHCSNCSFSTNKVNNIVSHMNYCSSKESIGRLLDYSVDDMDRRQRIRGEDMMESWYEKELNTSFLSNGSVENDLNEPSCSSISHELSADDSDDDETNDTLQSKNNFGYKEKSIVWVQKGKGYWPALIWRLKKGKAYVYLIATPVTAEMLKVDLKQLHSFDDAKWNNQLLKQANKYPDKDNFVKAVQKCQSYLNKKLLGQRRIDVRNFFKITDNVKFSDSDDEEGKWENVLKEHLSLESDEDNKQCHSLKSQGIADCILQGAFDDDLISIYKKQTYNERHTNFFKKSYKDRLAFTASFGPFKKNADMDRVFTHLDELFRTRIGEEPHKLSYIYEVWIPEAITKAISVTKHITLDEAKTLFYNIRPE